MQPILEDATKVTPNQEWSARMCVQYYRVVTPLLRKELYTRSYVYLVPLVKIGLLVDDKKSFLFMAQVKSRTKVMTHICLI